MGESIAAARVRREINEFQKKDDCQGIILNLDGNDLMKLRGEIDGPPDTPYAGGKYQLAIEIPSTYPFNPPKVKFTTHLWHPNISSVTGAICLDILASRWAAAMTLRTVLLSIQALLESPEPDDPQDAVVAQQYTSNRGMWQSTAVFWAQHFAGAPGAKNDQFNRNFQKVCEMGVDRKKALDALSQHNWNMDAAAKFLFN
jgi:ubiquitin-conjugating enzyme (huntingtin interacting protein 2)